MQDENEEAIEILLSKADKVSDLELGFLREIAEQDSLTERQQAELDKIWRRVMG